jgi:hypothetical protein
MEIVGISKMYSMRRPIAQTRQSKMVQRQAQLRKALEHRTQPKDLIESGEHADRNSQLCRALPERADAGIVEHSRRLSPGDHAQAPYPLLIDTIIELLRRVRPHRIDDAYGDESIWIARRGLGDVAIVVPVGGERLHQYRAVDARTAHQIQEFLGRQIANPPGGIRTEVTRVASLISCNDVAMTLDDHRDPLVG